MENRRTSLMDVSRGENACQQTSSAKLVFEGHLCVDIYLMAIRVVEFSNGGCKIRNIFD